VDIGPGLFTGLRVGVAAAKAVAAGLGLPVVTATSLEVLRAACPPSPGAVVPVVDMRRGEVAWIEPGPSPSEVRVGTPAELAAGLDGLGAPTTFLLLVGDGALRYRELLGRRPGTVFAGPELAAPPVASLAVLAFAAMQLGQGRDAAAVRPFYGREADARINWTSREGREAVGP